MPPASSAEIRTWAQANGHAVKDRGPLPAGVLEAYAAASSDPNRRSQSNATPAPPATVAAVAAPVGGQPGPRPSEPVTPMADPHVDVLAGRITRLEQQVAELAARLDAATTAGTVPLRRPRFGRRS